jgi:hypothetical protein
MTTKNTKLLLTAGAFAVFGALSLQACSSSDDSSGTPSGGSSGKGGSSAGGTSSGGKGGTAAGGKGGSGTAGSGVAGAEPGVGGEVGVGGAEEGGASGAGAPGAAGENAGGAGGATSEAHPTAQECTAFCDLDATTCTGTNNPYPGNDCQADCLAYALGDDSDPTHMAATTGDNFACRAYHLQNAIKNATNATLLTTHCGHTAKVSSICI